MKYFFLESDIAGEPGGNTVLDHSKTPPTVRKLEYNFYYWFGDVLLRTYRSWIITAAAMNEIQKHGFTGAKAAEVSITKSDDFCEQNPSLILPEFVWLKVFGTAGRDDFGTGYRLNAGSIDLFPYDARFYELVVSERALDLLKRLGIAHASVWTFSEPST